MEIQQIGVYTGDIISTILNNRGIKDVETFLYPSIRNYTTNINAIANIDLGIDTFLSHLENNSNIGLLIDDDTDGITSSAMMYGFIQDFTGGYNNISYYLHNRKAHGLTKDVVEKIKKDEINFLIIPDSATNDVEQIAELYQMGIEVLIIDHHEAEEGWQENRGILINNQLDGTNKNFVGAGMVLNFLRGVAERTGKPLASKYLDLVAVGQIADSSDISEPEIRGIVFYGLQNIRNPFLKHMLKEKEVVNCTPKDIGYAVAPLINAVTRLGSVEEKEVMFKAFAGIDTDKVFFVEKKKKNSDGKFDKVIVEMNILEYAYDLAVKIKGKQDRIVKKEVEEIKKNAITLGIGVGFITNKDIKGLTGLIAGRLSSSYGIPFLIGKTYEGFVDGSGRGNEKVLADFKEWCHSTKLFKLLQGHGNAFGFSIGEDEIGQLMELSKEIEVEKTYYVDLVVNEKIDHTLAGTLDKHKEIFGGKVTNPLFAFTNISVNKKLISHKGTTLSFYEDKFKFVKFNEDFDMDYLDSFAGDRVLVDFVGEISINRWNGMEQPQMIIKDYLIKEQPPKEMTLENIVF